MKIKIEILLRSFLCWTKFAKFFFSPPYIFISKQMYISAHLQLLFVRCSGPRLPLVGLTDYVYVIWFCWDHIRTKPYFFCFLFNECDNEFRMLFSVSSISSSGLFLCVSILNMSFPICFWLLILPNTLSMANFSGFEIPTFCSEAGDLCF